MERINFYSLGRVDGKIEAFLRNGYTDGCWYFYRARNVWYAVCPFTGVAIAAERTRKACVAKARDVSTLRVYDKARSCTLWEKWVDDYGRAIIRARLQEGRCEE